MFLGILIGACVSLLWLGVNAYGIDWYLDKYRPWRIPAGSYWRSGTCGPLRVDNVNGDQVRFHHITRAGGQFMWSYKYFLDTAERIPKEEEGLVLLANTGA
jgi:hypothetical protein